MARKLDDGDLHSQADPEVRDLIFPGIVGGADFAFDAAGAEPAGNQDAVGPGQGRRTILQIDLFGVDELQLHPAVIGRTAVVKRFVQAFIGFGQIRVFPDDGDIHLVFGLLEPFDQLFPFLQARRPSPDMQQLNDLIVQPLSVKIQGDFVNTVHILGGNNASSLTLQKSAILALISLGRYRSARHSRMSGWMPMLRSSLTLCWVRFGLDPPRPCGYREPRSSGMYKTLSLPTSALN